LLGVCRCSCLLQPAREGFPLPHCLLFRASRPLCFVSFCYFLLFSFSFFPGWGSVCPGGYADLAQRRLWEYCVLVSLPCGPRLPKLSRCWRLAVALELEPSWFPFNVKWRCYAWAGGVEESKFCFFWVVFPVRCISSVSPRVYFRRHTFCFLPLATILEFLLFS
jgi:hypothetical protein